MQAVCFDVDSTVIAEEGIDVLADFCGAAEAVADLTSRSVQLKKPRVLATSEALWAGIKHGEHGGKSGIVSNADRKKRMSRASLFLFHHFAVSCWVKKFVSCPCRSTCWDRPRTTTTPGRCSGLTSTQ